MKSQERVAFGAFVLFLFAPLGALAPRGTALAQSDGGFTSIIPGETVGSAVTDSNVSSDYNNSALGAFNGGLGMNTATNGSDGLGLAFGDSGLSPGFLGFSDGVPGYFYGGGFFVGSINNPVGGAGAGMGQQGGSSSGQVGFGWNHPAHVPPPPHPASGPFLWAVGSHATGYQRPGAVLVGDGKGTFHVKPAGGGASAWSNNLARMDARVRAGSDQFGFGLFSRAGHEGYHMAAFVPVTYAGGGTFALDPSNGNQNHLNTRSANHWLATHGAISGHLSSQGVLAFQSSHHGAAQAHGTGALAASHFNSSHGPALHASSAPAMGGHAAWGGPHGQHQSIPHHVHH